MLVHSVKGRNRSCCIIVAYLIYKYKWNLDKAIEYLRFRRPDIDIHSNFLKQLKAFEENIGVKASLSNDWTGSISFRR